MKKILIIFFSLFCLNLGAFAVGVDCWEEYTTSSTAPTSSNLRTAITNAGGTAILVGTRAHVARYDASISTNSGLGSLGATQFYSLGTSWSDGKYQTETMWFGNSGYSFWIYKRHNVHYVHTYCVVDSSSGGGGGGGATGSVNFIIKATS